MQETYSPFIEMLQKRWSQLRKQYQLFSSGQSPAIMEFENYSLFVAAHGKIHLGWKVQNAHKITISGIGEVTGKSEIVAKMPANTHQFTLTAYGGLKKATKTIAVKVADIKADNFPSGDFGVPSPAIKSIGFKQKGGIFNQASKSSDKGVLVRWPEPPAPADLKRLRESLKDHLEVKKLEALEAHLAKIKQGDLLDKQEIFNTENPKKQANLSE